MLIIVLGLLNYVNWYLCLNCDEFGGIVVKLLKFVFFGFGLVSAATKQDPQTLPAKQNILFYRSGLRVLMLL